MFHLRRSNEATSQHFLAVHEEMAKLEEEMNCQLSSFRESLTAHESSWAECEECVTQISILVQSLQVTSYKGEFVWKIPEVARRMKEAIVRKTFSLYSALFFTSHFGYCLCLRLYLNGDDLGKGTLPSFFLAIMRGEYTGVSTTAND